MNKQYEEYAYFDGHRGTHIGNGIYKIDEPYITTLMSVFDNPSTNSFGILYTSCKMDVGASDRGVIVKYFKDGYGKRRLLYDELFKSLSGKDLHYLEPIKLNEIGGLWPW